MYAAAVPSHQNRRRWSSPARARSTRVAPSSPAWATSSRTRTGSLACPKRHYSASSRAPSRRSPMTQPEIRVAADTWPETELEFRAEADGDGLTFSGYAAVFDSLSDDLGGFREIIRPGAFGESLRARRDIKMFHNHNSDIVLASKKAGTLKLIE